MEELYENSQDFRSYVDKYCLKHGKTVEEALQDAIVIEYGKVMPCVPETKAMLIMG